MAALLAACGGSGQELDRRTVHVYAASSLRETVEELASVCEAECAGVELVLNFGASNFLAQQALAARQSDVFLSADTLQMDALARGGLVVAEAPRPWLSNQLVVVVPSTSTLLEIDGVSGLLRAPIARFSVGNPEAVPVGRYAQAWLQQAGAWDALADRVVPGTDARAALAAVESGACEAGIVYSTDAEASEHTRVVYRVPLADAPRIEYSLGLLRGQAPPAAARAVYEFFLTPAAREAFADRGFLRGGD